MLIQLCNHHHHHNSVLEDFHHPKKFIYLDFNFSNYIFQFYVFAYNFQFSGKFLNLLILWIY